MGNKSTSSLCHDSSDQGSQHSIFNLKSSSTSSCDNVIPCRGVRGGTVSVGDVTEPPPARVKTERSLDVRIYRSYSSSAATRVRTVPTADLNVDIKVLILFLIIVLILVYNNETSIHMLQCGIIKLRE